ncbi:E3 ubiquitin-protein ligase RBBP6-like [Takifugu flavidus]|nr:E3 ubiquitin-protein ligase RBBP6-like [Takifugu flavidus]
MMMVKGQSVNAPQKMEMYNGLPQSIKAEEGAKGAMLASTVYKKGLKQNKKRPPFHPPIQPDFKVVSTVPVELMCVICTRLMVDAVIVPCCGYSFCDNCIRTTLIESEEGMCVACQQTASPECIYPNLSLRLAITNFKSNTGYIKCKRRKTETQGDEQQSRSPRHPPSCVSH